MVVTFREVAAALAKGLAQLVFADSVSAGFLVFFGLALISPWGALGAVAGAAFGTIAGRLVPSCPRADWDHGIAGFNCAIVGLFWAGHIAQGAFNLPLFLTLLAVCVAVEVGLRRALASVRLPALSLPAVVTLLAASLALAPRGTWFWIETPASSFGPISVIIALVFFIVAMGTKSVTAAAWSVILSVSCYLAIKLLGHDTAAYANLWAVNIPLATIAMTGVFLRHTALSLPAGALAATVAGILWLIWTAVPVSVVAPPLFVPYVVGVWCAIIAARYMEGVPILQPAFWHSVWAIRKVRAEGRTVVALLGGSKATRGHALQVLGSVRCEGDEEAVLATAERLNTSSRCRRAFWQACAELRDSARQGAMTDLHTLLAGMERRGILDAIISQDDGTALRTAGARQVIELHGPVDEVGCLDCNSALPWPPGRMWQQCDLLCTDCGGLIVPRSGVLRSDIVPAIREVLDSHLADCGVLLIPGEIIPHPAVDFLFERLHAAGGIAVILNDKWMPRAPGRGELKVPGLPTSTARALDTVASVIKLVPGHQTAPRPTAGNVNGSVP